MEYDYRLLGSDTVQAGRQVLKLQAKALPSSTNKTRECRKRIFLFWRGKQQFCG